MAALARAAAASGCGTDDTTRREQAIVRAYSSAFPTARWAARCEHHGDAPPDCVAHFVLRDSSRLTDALTLASAAKLAVYEGRLLPAASILPGSLRRDGRDMAPARVTCAGLDRGDPRVPAFDLLGPVTNELEPRRTLDEVRRAAREFDCELVPIDGGPTLSVADPG